MDYLTQDDDGFLTKKFNKQKYKDKYKELCFMIREISGVEITDCKDFIIDEELVIFKNYDSEYRCLCHKRINNICLIKNIKTDLVYGVGTKCIEKFQNDKMDLDMKKVKLKIRKNTSGEKKKQAKKNWSRIIKIIIIKINNKKKKFIIIDDKWIKMYRLSKTREYHFSLLEQTNNTWAFENFSIFLNRSDKNILSKSQLSCL